MINGSIELIEDILKLKLQGEDLDKLDSWLKENSFMMNCINQITRHLAYMLSNFSFLFNIKRWQIFIRDKNYDNDNSHERRLHYE